jgi:hypothetical protein
MLQFVHSQLAIRFSNSPRAMDPLGLDPADLALCHKNGLKIVSFGLRRQRNSRKIPAAPQFVPGGALLQISPPTGPMAIHPRR